MGYFIFANTTNSFTTPIDGTMLIEDNDLSDGVAVVNVPFGTEGYSFTGLSPETHYYFSIYSYSNTSGDIDYKTDGIIP